MHKESKQCHCSLLRINFMLFPDQDTVSEHCSVTKTAEFACNHILLNTQQSMTSVDGFSSNQPLE